MHFFIADAQPRLGFETLPRLLTECAGRAIVVTWELSATRPFQQA